MLLGTREKEIESMQGEGGLLSLIVSTQQERYDRQGRIRKKMQLEDVKGRLLALQCEAQNLQRIYDDFIAANILLVMGKMESSTV